MQFGWDGRSLVLPPPLLLPSFLKNNSKLGPGVMYLFMYMNYSLSQDAYCVLSRCIVFPWEFVLYWSRKFITTSNCVTSVSNETHICFGYKQKILNKFVLIIELIFVL